MPTPSKRQRASRDAAVSARRASVVAQLGSALAQVIPAVPLPSTEQLVANAVQGRRTRAAAAQTSTVAAALASAVEEGTPLLHLNAVGAVALDLELAVADVKALSAVCKAQLSRPPERDHFTRLGWKVDPLSINVRQWRRLLGGGVASCVEAYLGGTCEVIDVAVVATPSDATQAQTTHRDHQFGAKQAVGLFVDVGGVGGSCTTLIGLGSHHPGVTGWNWSSTVELTQPGLSHNALLLDLYAVHAGAAPTVGGSSLLTAGGRSVTESSVTRLLISCMRTGGHEGVHEALTSEHMQHRQSFADLLRL